MATPSARIPHHTKKKQKDRKENPPLRLVRPLVRVVLVRAAVVAGDGGPGVLPPRGLPAQPAECLHSARAAARQPAATVRQVSAEVQAENTATAWELIEGGHPHRHAPTITPISCLPVLSPYPARPPLSRTRPIVYCPPYCLPYCSPYRSLATAHLPAAAHHQVAPPRLLHRLLALGAGLGVGVEPGRGLGAVLHAPNPVGQPGGREQEWEGDTSGKGDIR